MIISARRPSVRPSSVVVNFSLFRHLLWNRWMEFNETWQEARSERPLPSFCFLGRSEKQNGRPGLWFAETFSTSPLKPPNGIQRNLIGSKISRPLPSFFFFFLDRSEKQNGRPGLWLADLFSTSHLKLLNGIQGNLTESKISSSSTKFAFSGRPKKQDGRPGFLLVETFSTSPLKPLNGIQRILTGSKISTSSTKFVFCDRSEKQNGPLASDWLRHFRFLLWNRWWEFNETWQEARSECPPQSLCFSDRLEKQDGRPGFWLAGTFSTSSLKPLNRIQRNLTGSKISTSSTKFVFFRTDRKNKMAALVSDWLTHFRLLLWNCWTEFNETWQKARSQRPLPSLCLFGPIGKTRWPPWPLIGWDFFDFSSETAEQNSKKLDGKQDLNVLYKVCIFRGHRKN